jgi:hypothetical protein
LGIVSPVQAINGTVPEMWVPSCVRVGSRKNVGKPKCRISRKLVNSSQRSFQAFPS